MTVSRARTAALASPAAIRLRRAGCRLWVWLTCLLCCLLSAHSAAAAPAAAGHGRGVGPGVLPAGVAPWQQEVVYQIYPRSFADGDGDGIGDLKGILGKVDYLRALGVDVVWLNPIYASTHFDSGYDVTDYTAIDPTFGTLDDWRALRDALHARGMKIMMDMVLNHSSDGHPWFVQEVRLKQLQHALTTLIRGCDTATGERIVNLVADPGSAARVAPGSGPEGAAAAALIAFTADEGTAATAAGYPTLSEQLGALARALAPCAANHRGCASVEQPFDDFYLWRDRPNNWTSLFSGSAWHKIEGTSGYAMSLFSVHQKDLNWRNPRLRAAMGHVIETWEARGVDGLRLDSAGSIAKNPSFPNAKAGTSAAPGRGIEYFEQLPEVHRYLQELSAQFTRELRSIGEVAFNKADAPLLYAGRDRGELNEVFVFDHMAADCNGPKWRAKPFDVPFFKKSLAAQQQLVHGRAWLGNYLENHDQLRLVSRFGDPGALRERSGKLFATLLMTLEGTPYIYQGQEIGMTNLPESTFTSIDDVDDIEGRNYYLDEVRRGADPAQLFHQVATRNRDHVRSAIAWDGGANAGFSRGTPQVRVNDNYRTINVAQSIADPDSLLHTYQKLIVLRRTTPSWIIGRFVDELPKHPKVFAYSRRTDSEHTLVLLNISGQPQHITLGAQALPTHVRQTLGNCAEVPAAATEVTLQPWEARVYVGDNAPALPAAAALPATAARRAL